MGDDTTSRWVDLRNERQGINEEPDLDDPEALVTSVDQTLEPHKRDYILYPFYRGNVAVLGKDVYDAFIKTKVFVQDQLDDDVSNLKEAERWLRSINTDAGGDPFKMVAEIWRRWIEGQGTWFVIPLKKALHNLVIVTKDPDLSATLFDITPDLVSLMHSILKGVEDADILQDYVIPKLPGLDVILKLVDVDMWTDQRTGKTVTLAGLLLSAAIIAVVVKVLMTLIPMITKNVLTAMVGIALNTSVSGLNMYKSMKANKKLYGRFNNIDAKLLEIEGAIPPAVVIDYNSSMRFWI